MDSWIPLIFIVLAVTLVIGPVMWLRPSKRQVALAKLRQKAASDGLSVRMAAIPESEGSGTAAVYYLPWQKSSGLSLGWGLERRSISHDLHFSGQWDWQGSTRPPQSAQPYIKEAIADMPEGYLALFANPAGLGIQWRETGGDVAYSKLLSLLRSTRSKIEPELRISAV